jgi:radical SAM superfamily enzyme YgiQ (UPF0313 family)
MRILFIFPNIRTLLPSVYPLGIGQLSAILKKNGYEIRVLCLNKEDDMKKIYPMIKEFKPQIVGFYSITSQYLYVKRIIDMIKHFQGISIICGGAHPTLSPEDFIKLEGVEGVLIGEGDKALLEYVKAKEKGKNFLRIKNFWFKKDGKIVKNKLRAFIKNLDSLPFDDRKIVDYQKIIDENNDSLYIVAGRGCPYDCKFCGAPVLNKKGKGEFVRLRSVKSILNEIEKLSKIYRFSYVYFRDDTFTWNKKWTLEFCKEYRKRIKYPFEILTRADCLDKQIMDALKKANCQCIWIGIDSGNEYIRNKVLNKAISNNKILEVCKYLTSIGIKPMMTNMVGLPYETPEKFNDTVELNKKIYSAMAVVSAGTGSGPKIFVFSPFHGTPLYDVCKKEGWIRTMPHNFRGYKESIINMPNFPREEVYAARRRFRYLVYKDTHPLAAWMFRIYDSRIAEFAVSLIPKPFFGAVTRVFSTLSSQNNREQKGCKN